MKFNVSKKTAITLLFAFILFKTFSQTSPVVTRIDATGESSNLITVSWSLPENLKNIYVSSFYIYKSNKPITSYASIQDIKPLAKLPHGTLAYNDYTSENVEFYYAVVSATTEGELNSNGLFWDEELDKLEQKGEEKIYPLIIPGVNATIKGAKIKIKKLSQTEAKPQVKDETKKTYENNKLREQPLPFVDVFGEEKNHIAKISKNTEYKAKDLGNTKPIQKKLLTPYIFEEDIILPAGGDDYFLFDILKKYFINKKYKQSIAQLSAFLAQNRSTEVQSRAKFYLGQSYYFEGEYSKALINFLEIEDTYPILTKKWMDSALDFYEAN